MSTNGVEPESHQLSAADVNVNPLHVQRQPAGRWTAFLDVVIDVTLPDGRQLKEERRVAIGGILQRGRKKRKNSR